jgi:hypothetical protein
MDKLIEKITLTKRKSGFKMKSLNQTTSSLCNPGKKREKRTNIKTSPNIKGKIVLTQRRKIGEEILKSLTTKLKMQIHQKSKEIPLNGMFWNCRGVK